MKPKKTKPKRNKDKSGFNSRFRNMSIDTSTETCDICLNPMDECECGDVEEIDEAEEELEDDEEY